MKEFRMKSAGRLKAIGLIAAAWLTVLVLPPPLQAAQRVVFRPSMSAPTLILPGGKFEAETRLSGAATLAMAVLKGRAENVADVKIPLDAMQVEGAATFDITAPADAAPGLYDFCLLYEHEAKRKKDCRPKAVAIVGEFKKPFRFAIFSDYHVGDDRALEFNPGISPEELRAKGMAALRAEKPDFVLVTGDINFFPTSYWIDYKTAYDEFLNGIEAPIFMVPGNHDLYDLGEQGGDRFDGLVYWEDTFGPTHMAFTYGPYRFIGFNSYSWPANYRDQTDDSPLKDLSYSSSGGVIALDEFNWIEKELEYAKANALEPVPFAHHGLPGLSLFEGAEDFQVLPVPEFFAALRDFGTRHYFHGHTHVNKTRDENGIELVCTNTVGSGIGRGDAWSFRVVDVAPDGAFDMRIVETWRPREE